MITNRPKFIIIHHAIMKDLRDGKSTERIDRWHKKKNKFKLTPVSKVYCGYQYVIEYKGNKVIINKCRLLTERGAHAIGFNNKSVGVCVVGFYDKNELEDDKKEALTNLCVTLCKENNKIIPENAIGHYETYIMRKVRVEKTCPGLKISMKKIRQEVIKRYGKWKQQEEV